MKRRLGIVFAAVAAAGCLALNTTAVYAKAEPKTSLQQRIDEATSGAVVIIPSGTYEGPIRIDRPLTLKAEKDGTVTLFNAADQPAISIDADHVQVKGITIIDQSVKPSPSVLVTGHQVLLDGLSIQTVSYGIMMIDANNGTVLNSVIEWGAEQSQPFINKGNGIDLYNAHRVLLEGNTIIGMFDGIYLENSDDTTVLNNLLEHNRYGVHSMYTEGTVIRGNRGTMNNTGAMVMVVRNVELAGNTFTKQNENVNSQGILLFDAHDSTIIDNIVEGNRVGLYIERSTNNRLERNEITNNFIGIQLLASEQNIITENQFVGNVSDALTRDSANNEISGNYWDAFAGIDADGDGRSDIAYAMNPFFQSLIQKRPAFQIFFQNPGIGFLEGLYESNARDWTTDRLPLMEPPQVMHKDSANASERMSIIMSTLFLTITVGIILASWRSRIWQK